MSQKKYRAIGMGGTFDHFHVGHEFFLDFAANLADELRIGITTSDLTKHKVLSDLIEPYEVRAQAVAHYLDEKQVKYSLFPLENVFGPTLNHSVIEAVAVTEATRKGGEIINAERQKRDLPTLPIHVCQLLKDAQGEDISSTRIRQGLINRRGDIYSKVLSEGVNLNETQREYFREKQGNIVKSPNDKYSPIYVIGDIVLETFVQHKWPYNVGIFDGHSKKIPYKSTALNNLNVTNSVPNQQGSITHELVSSLKQLATEKEALLLVEGEEDLAAVALVLLAPLNSVIYYGQPNEGIVEMVVTEELKEKFASILR